jgi:hypothetical protein
MAGDWRTSSYTGGTGNCVEVADAAYSVVIVRDTKDRGGMVLAIPISALRRFIKALK